MDTRIATAPVSVDARHLIRKLRADRARAVKCSLPRAQRRGGRSDRVRAAVAESA